MFKKLGRALGGGGGGGKGSVRVKFDVQVVQVDRLPTAVRKCRVVLARSAKVSMTATKDARNGARVQRAWALSCGGLTVLVPWPNQGGRL